MPRTKIIGEVASNHGGDLNLAREFVRIAAEVGVDYVKFQSWRAATLRDGQQDPQYEWLVRAELSDAMHHELIAECQRHEIGFLTTVFDVGRVDFLAMLGLDTIKVGSADATSYRLLEKLKGHFAHIIISCGLAMANEVAATARLMSGQDFTLMHAVSLYPAPLAKVNLKRMDWLRQFTPSVGYSDHTVGTEAAKLAIARGADYVEKHFCLGRYGPGRAMPWDATPEQMAELVEYARSTDEMLGIEEPEPNAEWMEARQRFIGRFGDNR